MKKLHCRLRLLVLLLIAGLFIPAAKSQVPNPATPTIIKGAVLDDKNEPLVGVSISVKGTDTSVISDKNGHYQIRVMRAKAVLVFSYVNHEKREVPVNGR